MKDYAINVFFSEEDDCYVADIPDLRYCSAFGATPEIALKEVMRAKKAWLKTAAEAGKPIPKPKYRPAAYSWTKKKPMRDQS
ncbi:MAG: type II toxin-antitoxin system HicB family antitoxin [Gemmataceae bacterium]